MHGIASRIKSRIPSVSTQAVSTTLRHVLAIETSQANQESKYGYLALLSGAAIIGTTAIVSSNSTDCEGDAKPVEDGQYTQETLKEIVAKLNRIESAVANP